MNPSEDLANRFAAVVSEHELNLEITKAITYQKNGLFPEAANTYMKILAIDELNVTALNNLSLMLNNDTALPLLRKVLSISPDNLDALINISIRLLSSEEYGEALAHLQRAQVIAPQDARVSLLFSQLPANTLATVRSLTNNGSPKYSVIMPTHRRGTLLARALSSIKAQVKSNLVEVIVVSDCSDEQTDDICRKLLDSTDTYVRRSGMPGPSASRNLALKIAQGQFILFLDDDDSWHPQLLEALEACIPLQLGQTIYFNCTVVKERREPDGPVFLSEIFCNMKGRLTEEVFVKNQVHMSCFAFPRHVLQGLSFDAHMRAYEDWDYLLYAFSRQMPLHVDITGSKVYEVDDHTSDRRGSSQVAQDQNALLDYLYVYRRHPVSTDLQEKRAQLLSSSGLDLPPILL